MPGTPQQIECNEPGFTTAKEQIAEFSLARIVQADDFTIENDRLDLQFGEQ